MKAQRVGRAQVGGSGRSGEKCDCGEKAKGARARGVNLLDKSSERASVNRY